MKKVSAASTSGTNTTEKENTTEEPIKEKMTASPVTPVTSNSSVGADTVQYCEAVKSDSTSFIEQIMSDSQPLKNVKITTDESDAPFVKTRVVSTAAETSGRFLGGESRKEPTNEQGNNDKKGLWLSQVPVLTPVCPKRQTTAEPVGTKRSEVNPLHGPSSPRLSAFEDKLTEGADDSGSANRVLLVAKEVSGNPSRPDMRFEKKKTWPRQHAALKKSFEALKFNDEGGSDTADETNGAAGDEEQGGVEGSDGVERQGTVGRTIKFLRTLSARGVCHELLVRCPEYSEVVRSAVSFTEYYFGPVGSNVNPHLAVRDKLAFDLDAAVKEVEADREDLLRLLGLAVSCRGRLLARAMAAGLSVAPAMAYYVLDDLIRGVLHENEIREVPHPDGSLFSFEEAGSDDEEGGVPVWEQPLSYTVFFKYKDQAAAEDSNVEPLPTTVKALVCGKCADGGAAGQQNKISKSPPKKRKMSHDGP